jgi:hypothetical protein
VKCLDIQFSLKAMTAGFNSCSLVNADGHLIFSKDQSLPILTTTRLVAFQIVKKYLKPQPGDMFILNDPENGGFQYSRLIFISALSANLFLIWDEDFHFVDFKIPPTPLYDQGAKNEFVWKALIQASPYPSEFETFVLFHKYKVDKVASVKKSVDELSSKENQVAWLKSTQEIFDIQFNNKALGNFESQFKLKNGQFIKMKFSAEERQNLRLFTLDFTNTNLATDFHAASHVVESAIIRKIAEYYGFGDFFSQSILDKIKVILPPRSIVAKPHPSGDANFEIQAICAQLCEHNLLQLNSHSRKAHAPFQFSNFLNFQMLSGEILVNGHITPQAVALQGFEELINSQHVEVRKMRRSDKENQVSFQVLTDSINLKINNRYQTDDSNISFKVNNVAQNCGPGTLKKSDVVDIEWR